jgi:hypothetical protein
MAFDVDIFISYAHIDNMALKEGENGWVANFHKALEVRLAQLVGERPRIWRDKKLQGNDFFGDEIVQQFPNTALMISVLSPRYIKSEWCTREVKEFFKAASSHIGPRVGNKSRIFKIIKTAIPFNAHPVEIADTLGYEFFVADSDTGKIKELPDNCPPDLEHLYWAKLDDIAHDIRDLLSQLKEPGLAPDAEPGEQITVYLSETTSDLREQRDMIKRQLVEYGCRVLPDAPLPLVQSELTDAVSNYLDQSLLAIHLVADSYGVVPEGSQKSTIMLQNEMAAQKSKAGNLQRLIWLLAGDPAKNERQQAFINLLRTSPDEQFGADLFETSIEDFKTAVKDKLNALQNAASAGKDPFQSISTVYLAETNHELKDERERIKSQLIERGCKVLPDKPLPLIYSQLSEVIDNLLEQCDVSIHLVGEHYGVVPEETDKSILFIQDQRAAEKSAGGNLERLVWVSPVIDQEDGRQQEFIQALKTASTGQPHAGVFETPLPQMEAAVFEKLQQLEEKRRKPTAAETTGNDAQGPRLVYLICDQGDLDNEDTGHLAKLEDYLFESGFDVVLPVFDGKEEDIMNDHHENLRTCDAVIIYYGSGSELWMRSISRDLTKIAGYGRARPLLAKAVFLGPPGSRQKERFRSHDLLSIKGAADFSPQLLTPFIEKLK